MDVDGIHLLLDSFSKLLVLPHALLVQGPVLKSLKADLQFVCQFLQQLLLVL